MHRYRLAWLISLCALTLAAAPAIAAPPYKPPHNALGQPDFEGLWSDNSQTRLERPRTVSTLVLSEAEARAHPPPPILGEDPVGTGETEGLDDLGLGWASLIGTRRPVTVRSAVTENLATDRGGRATQLTSDPPQRTMGAEAAGYLLPLAEAERLGSASP